MDAERIVLLSGVVGSTAYGLDHEGSDIDRMGIFAWPTEKFFALESPKDYFEVRTQLEDISLHEAKKFVSLALSGNPTVSELLWVDEYEVQTVWGAEIVAMRQSFLCAHRVREAYLGYARQQFYKLREVGGFSSSLRNRTEKHARHLRRLVEQGLGLYITGELHLRVENPEEIREFGRRAAENPEVATEYMRWATDQWEDAKTSLPDQPDHQRATEWLVRLRKDLL